MVENRHVDKNSCIECLNSSFALLNQGMFFEAYNILKQTDYREIEESSLGMAYRYRGLASFYMNNYEEASACFEKGVEYGDLESGLWKKLLFIKARELITVKNLSFHFVDELQSIEKKKLIITGMKMYANMQAFFDIDLKKIIDIYIYNKPYDALGNRLSYTDNGMKIIYLYKSDYLGHEMVHLFANSLSKSMKRNHFIDEGIATFLSSNLNFAEYIEKFNSKFGKFDLIKVWEANAISKDYLQRDGEYFVSGALVGFLLEEYGKDRFIEFVKNQSYENAKKIYGHELSDKLSSFQGIIGL